METLSSKFDWLLDAGAYLYIYCTDFVINAANLLGLSYFEVNAFLFLGLYPLFFIVVGTIYARQVVRYKALLKKINPNEHH